MDDNVGSIFDWAKQDLSGNRVVDYQWQSMFARNLSQRLDIADVSRRVACTLTKERARLFIDQPFDRLRMIGLGESDRHSLVRKKVSEEHVRGPVQLRNINNVAPPVR